MEVNAELNLTLEVMWSYVGLLYTFYQSVYAVSSFILYTVSYLCRGYLTPEEDYRLRPNNQCL